MNLFDLVKKTHQPHYIVILDNKRLFTINKFISVISVINITDIDIEFNDFIIKESDKLITSISTTIDILKPSYEIYNNILDPDYKDEPYTIEDTRFKFDKKISELVKSKFNDTTRYNMSYYVEDLKSHPIISDLLKSKAADGQFKLKLYNDNKRYLVTLFKGIIPVNKPDIVSLSILENESDSSFFYARFDIFKKKDKIFIEEYIGYLKV